MRTPGATTGSPLGTTSSRSTTTSPWRSSQRSLDSSSLSRATTYSRGSTAGAAAPVRLRDLTAPAATSRSATTARSLTGRPGGATTSLAATSTAVAPQNRGIPTFSDRYARGRAATSTITSAGAVPSASAVRASGAVPNVAASSGAVPQTGYYRGVYVTSSYGGRYLHSSAYPGYAYPGYGCYPYYSSYYCHPYYYYPGYCSPYYGFSFAFGFPYWSFYYSGYPYYYSPYYYHRYPYSYGVYVGYPDSPTYVENNYYYDTDSTSQKPAEESAVAAPADEGKSKPRPAERTTPADDITPIPAAEMVPAPAPEQPPAASQAAQLALAGLSEFRSGLYSEAAESLFAASQAQPRSNELKVYLAQALFAIGEYSFAADYLRQAFEERPDLASRPFPLSRLYAPAEAGEKDLDLHYGMLVDRVQLYPSEANELLLLGFVQLNTGRTQEAAATFSALRDSAVHSADVALAGRFAIESQLRLDGLADGIAPADLPAARPVEEEEFAMSLASALE